MEKLLFWNQDVFPYSVEDMFGDLMDGKMSDKLIFPGYISVIGFVWYYLGVFLFIMLIQYFFSETC